MTMKNINIQNEMLFWMAAVHLLVAALSNDWASFFMLSAILVTGIALANGIYSIVMRVRPNFFARLTPKRAK
jgi:hypothetical protein